MVCQIQINVTATAERSFSAMKRIK